MTAEIAVLNKSGVALAADSAASIVTDRNTKIYNVNKLFMLSKYQPVGVMLYGSAELMRVPWEIIIKRYRKELGTQSFKSLQEYGADFIRFLNGNTYLFPHSAQEDHVYGITFNGLSGLKRRIDKAVEERTHTGVKVSASEIEEITNRVIKKAFNFITSELKPLATLPASMEKDLLSKYYKIINEAIDDVFKKHNPSSALRKQLRRISLGLFSKDTFNVLDNGRQLINSSGIVVSGYGDEDLFPSVVSYEMEGVISDTLKYREGSKVNISSSQTAALLPFAQGEMVISFMTGITPNYKETLTEYLRVLFDKYPNELVDKFPRLKDADKAALLDELKQVGSDWASWFWEKVNEWSKDNHVNPILNTVALLPIDELASMAESLVNLTSFKRRVTLVAETVGGPIDVAVISKGDGFIWIKRKHYFDAAANPHFLTNYYR
jgi:hypothetical protein